jgi:hypothetical protein
MARDFPRREDPMTLFIRFGIVAAVAFGAALVAAVGVALLDLFLAGHGYGSMSREVIRASSWGVHLSSGDLLMFIAALGAGQVAWRRSSPPR